MYDFNATTIRSINATLAQAGLEKFTLQALPSYSIDTTTETVKNDAGDNVANAGITLPPRADWWNSWSSGAYTQSLPQTILYARNIEKMAQETNLTYEAVFNNILRHELTHNVFQLAGYYALRNNPKSTYNHELFAQAGTLNTGNKQDAAVDAFLTLDSWIRARSPTEIYAHPTYQLPAKVFFEAAKATLGEKEAANFIANYSGLPEQQRNVHGYAGLFAKYAPPGLSGRELETRLVDNFVAKTNAMARQLRPEVQEQV
jgi:hypothetical protein